MDPHSCPFSWVLLILELNSCLEHIPCPITCKRAKLFVFTFWFSNFGHQVRWIEFSLCDIYHLWIENFTKASNKLKPVWEKTHRFYLVFVLSGFPLLVLSELTWQGQQNIWELVSTIPHQFLPDNSTLFQSGQADLAHYKVLYQPRCLTYRQY